jgi:hypothetical protein
MKKLKFKIGDYVVIHNPYEKYPNKENVRNKVGRITKIRDNYDLAYRVEFIELVKGITKIEGHIYSDDELRLATENEILMAIL